MSKSLRDFDSVQNDSETVTIPYLFIGMCPFGSVKTFGLPFIS
jgi:hypothetical protein